MNCEGLRSAAELSANKPHGMRIKYLGGCKCLLCRAANSRYVMERSIAQKAGGWDGIVDASAARRHIHKLSIMGVGWKAVAAASDVGETSIAHIRTGKRTRIRRSTERAILEITKDAACDRALINADSTWRLIEKLLEEGFTKAELARRLGYRTPSLQIRRDQITAANACRVERFYRRIMAGGEA